MLAELPQIRNVVHESGSAYRRGRHAKIHEPSDIVLTAARKTLNLILKDQKCTNTELIHAWCDFRDLYRTLARLCFAVKGDHFVSDNEIMQLASVYGHEVKKYRKLLRDKGILWQASGIVGLLFPWGLFEHLKPYFPPVDATFRSNIFVNATLKRLKDLPKELPQYPCMLRVSALPPKSIPQSTPIALPSIKKTKRTYIADNQENLQTDRNESDENSEKNIVDRDTPSNEELAAIARDHEETLPETERLREHESTLYGKYLTDVFRYKLLTNEETHKLGLICYKYFQSLGEDLHQGSPLTPHEEGAYHKLVNHNLRLVISIAWKYWYKFCGRIPIMDLIQAGNDGLMRAVEKYNPTLGYRFPTYATWWIRQGITRYYLNNSRTVRVPVHLQEAYQIVKKSESILGGKTPETPSDDAVAELAGIDLERFQHIKIALQPNISLQTSIGEDDQTLEDIVPSPEIHDSEDSLSEQIFLENLIRTLLPPREQDIILWYYGFGDNEEMTLDTIGAKYGVTRERIRQLKKRALEVLRKHLEYHGYHAALFGIGKEYFSPQSTKQKEKKKCA